MSVKPDSDQPHHLIDFKNMFDPRAGLIVLRAESNKSENLIQMMRKYKVPVGMTDDEMERAT